MYQYGNMGNKSYTVLDSQVLCRPEQQLPTLPHLHANAGRHHLRDFYRVCERGGDAPIKETRSSDFGEYGDCTDTTEVILSE